MERAQIPHHVCIGDAPNVHGHASVVVDYDGVLDVHVVGDGGGGSEASEEAGVGGGGGRVECDPTL